MAAIAVLAMFAIGATSGACGGKGGAATPPTGDVGASLGIDSLDGARFDAASLRGKPAVIAFWSSTCVHCQKELPRLAALAHAANVPAVAVLVGHDRDRARAFLDRIAWSGARLVDDGALLRRYAIRAVPYVVVLRGDGTAARAFIGEQDDDTIVDAIAAAR